MQYKQYDAVTIMFPTNDRIYFTIPCYDKYSIVCCKANEDTIC